MKYVTVKIGDIITRIAETTEVKGYTKAVFEAFLPDEDEMNNWSEKEIQLWIKRNNARMTLICEVLNEKNI